MKKFDQDKFNKFLLDNNVIGFSEEPITLKSDRKSHWYANCRRLTDYVCYVCTKDDLMEYMLRFIRDNNIFADYFYGVPEGATKIGLFLTDWVAHEDIKEMPLIMGRGKEKEHGKVENRYFLGPVKGRAVIVEDVTTTGSSLIKEIKKLREAGATVEDAIGIVNRMELHDGKSVEEKVNELGVKYYSMSDALQLLPLACKKYNPSKEIIEAVEKYYKEYGVKEIKLL